MPWIRAGGREVEYDRYETDPNTGHRIFYDADGNVMFYKDPEAADSSGEGGFYNVYTDPETGQQYTSDFVDNQSYGLMPKLRNKRDARKTARRRKKAQQAARAGYYGQMFNEQLGGIAGAYEGLEEEMPTELDLLGGREWQDSELAGAQADAEAIESQKAALAALENIARGGYSPEEAAAMQRMRMETAQQEQAQRQALQQQFAARGMAGGGAEIAAQLAAQQGGANRANEMTLETQAQAQRRALQALAAQGDLSSGIRGQSFDEEATRRSAVDDFNRWNLERRGGAAQQGYDNRFGLSQAQSQAAGQTAQLAAQRRQEIITNKKEKKQAIGEGVTGGVEAVGSFF